MRTSHVFVLVLAGCGVDAPPPVVTPPDLVPYESICRHIECGNSPEVARNGLHEASLFGVPDDFGIHLETGGKTGRAQLWSAAGVAYDLHVEGDRLFGLRGSSVLEGADLNGATMRVWQGDVRIYDIRIEAPPRQITMANDSATVEVYRMHWVPLVDGKPSEELCNVPKVRLRGEDLLGMRSDEVLVFEGDRIERFTKTMSKDEEWDPQWFNLGCAGRTLAKLKLTRNTTRSQLASSWVRRQATLKMLAGDYCGGGTPYTLTGAPILWNDDSYIHYAGLQPTEVEARWTELGATCINGVRLERTAFPEAATILQEVYADCLLLSCLDRTMFPQGLDDFSDGAAVISAYRPY